MEQTEDDDLEEQLEEEEDEEVEDIILEEDEDAQELIDIEEGDEIEDREDAIDIVELIEDELDKALKADDILESMGEFSGTPYPKTQEDRLEANKKQTDFSDYINKKSRELNQFIQVPKGIYLIEGKKLFVRGFKIHKFPVTNALFQAFVEQTGYITTAEKLGYSYVYEPKVLNKGKRLIVRPFITKKRVKGACWHMPDGPNSTIFARFDFPVVHISLRDALAFCAWTGTRLPTFLEWEIAACGPNALPYPWGKEFYEDQTNIGRNTRGMVNKVSEFIKYPNKIGLVDVLGNCWEWTFSQDEQKRFLLKGGSWAEAMPVDLFSSISFPPDYSANNIGFRCVLVE